MQHMLELEVQGLRVKIRDLGNRLRECTAHLERTERERREAVSEAERLRKESAGLKAQLQNLAPSQVH